MFGDIQELLVIFIVAFLVVGPKKLPEVARVMGKFMGEIKRALTEVRFEIDQEISGLSRTDEAHKEASEAAREMEVDLKGPQEGPEAENAVSVSENKTSFTEAEKTGPEIENIKNVSPETGTSGSKNPKMPTTENDGHEPKEGEISSGPPEHGGF